LFYLMSHVNRKNFSKVKLILKSINWGNAVKEV
jgi:hypothetical protein